MGIISFGKKNFILPSFRSITKTSVFEGEKDKLVKEFQEFTAFEQSEELAAYFKLEQYIKSNEFLDQKKSAASKRQDEKAKETKYLGLKKQKNFRQYFKMKGSQKLNDFISYGNSAEFRSYEILEKLIHSDDFLKQKKDAESGIAELEGKEKQYAELKKSTTVSRFLKTQDSDELKWFLTYHESAELKHYMDLEIYINSDEFTKQNGNKKGNGDKPQEEDKKWLDYKEMRSHSNIKRYFSFLNSADYNHFKSFKISKEYKEYEELDKYLASKEFSNKKSELIAGLNSLKTKEEEFKKLGSSTQVKHYFKFKNSTAYNQYNEFDKSKDLADYLSLEAYLGSDERKTILKELEASETFLNGKEKEYNEFTGSKKYKWYLAAKSSNKFDEIKKWSLAFEDNFDAPKLNGEKWITRYYYGDKLLNEGYSLSDDRHFFTDGKNFEISNSILSIITRKESAKGKAWTPPYGFIEKEFAYTSGLISTAASFRQKYGLFEAKIRMPDKKGLNFAFWMVADQILPQIDVVKSGSTPDEVISGIHTGNAGNPASSGFKHGSFKGVNTSSEFYIYSMEWTESKITWKINDVLIYEQSGNIPETGMYVVFSTGVTSDINDSGLPAKTQIDWIRCYKRA